MRTVVAFLLLTASVSAQEPTPDQWVAAGRYEANKNLQWYDQQIKQVEREVEAIRRRTTYRKGDWPQFSIEGSNGQMNFSCETQACRQIMLEARLHAIRTLKKHRLNSQSWLQPAISRLSAGQFGYMTFPQSVTTGYEPQPRDAAKLTNAERSYMENFVVSPVMQRYVAAPRNVVQVIDDKNVLIMHGSSELPRQIVMLSDYSTTGLVDGQDMEIKDPLYVAGTTTYAAAVGTNTVFVLKPISKDVQARLGAAITDEIKNPYKPRTWSDISGKFSVEAELTDFDGKTVYLRKKDGTESKVPFAKLSKDDKEYVQEQLGAP